MKAMILAAGKGERMRGLAPETPKPMLPIQGKPLLEYSIELLRQYSITDIAINLHHQAHRISQHFGNGAKFGVSIIYSHEEQLLGSAGAIKGLQWYFDETFLVLYGDVLTSMDLSALVNFHRQKKGLLTVALYRVDDPSSCGIVDMDESQGVKRFIEKPPPEQVFTDLANAGIYVVEPQVIDHIPEETPFDFGHDLFPRLLERGLPIYGYPVEVYLMDIGTPEKYERAQRDVEEGRLRGRAGALSH